MIINSVVCDEYSGLALLLANLIAKYADELEQEDDTEENQQPAVMNTTSRHSDTDAAQGSHMQASLHFFLANQKAA